ncbi:MAG: hypothetical protein O7D91_11610 [Planctomycetota bacterium]|nr:hypothetical protein [Planctomycetota bacterium]
MTDQVPIGSTVNIRVFLFNGAEALVGRSVNLSIERVSDGKFWDGVDFDPGTYTVVAMTEKTGHVHYEGVYEYNFAIPVADGEDHYDWSVKFTEGGWLTYFKGRIATVLNVWDEAVADHAAADTTGSELHLAKAALVNKRQHTIATGVDVIKDNDGTTTLRTLTPSETAGVITVTPS